MPAPCRSLYLVPPLEKGPVLESVRRLCSALEEKGGGAVVVSPGGPMVKRLGHRAVHVSLPQLHVKEVASLIREHNVNLIHAIGVPTEPVAAHFAPHLPLVFTIRDTCQDTFFARKKRWRALHHDQRFICISRYVERCLKETYDVEHTEVIYPGIALDVFNLGQVSQARMINLSRRWSLLDHHDLPIVMIIGTFPKPKLLHRALVGLNHPVRLVFIRQSSLSGSWAPHTVHYSGHCTDMPAAYKLADVVVVSTHPSQGFEHRVTEAMAMERLVVTSRQGSSEEQITHGDNGWLFENDDPSSLTEILDHMVSSEGTHHVAQKASLSARRLSADNTCQRTMAVYERLLS